MATSLFKMPFDVDRLKVQRIYASKELEHCTAETMSCDKIRKIYGDLKFLELHEDRPCTYFFGDLSGWQNCLYRRASGSVDRQAE